VKAKRGISRLSLQNEDATLFVVGARISSYCRKSVERPRAQRSAPPVAIRSKAESSHGARGQEPDQHERGRASASRSALAKGGCIREAGRSSSRERPDSEEVSWARSCFGTCASRETSTDGRCPGRQSARLSRGLRGADLGGLRASAWLSTKREATHPARRRRQGHQRRAVWFSRGGRERFLVEQLPGRRSGSCVVKRDSPRPRSHRAAPSFPVHATLVLGLARRRARDVRANEHGAERLRKEGGSRVVPKGIARV